MGSNVDSYYKKNYWVLKFTVNGTNLRMNIWYNNKAQMEKQTYY